MSFTLQIFPSVNDVNGGTAGAGIDITEANLVRRGQDFMKRNAVRYGFNYVSASGLTATFNATGEADIRGYNIVGSGTNPTVTLTANTTNYVWLQLTRDGSKNVTGAQLVATTSTVPPTYTAGGVLWTDAVLLASLVTNGSTVTSSTDLRPGTVKGSLTIKPLGAMPTPTGSPTGGTGYSRSYCLVGEDANANQGTASGILTLSGASSLNGTSTYDTINIPDMAGYERVRMFGMTAWDGGGGITYTAQALAQDGGTTFVPNNGIEGATLAFTHATSQMTYNGGAAVNVSSNQQGVVLHGGAAGLLTINLGTLPGTDSTNTVYTNWTDINTSLYGTTAAPPPTGTSYVVQSWGHALASTIPTRDATGDVNLSGGVLIGAKAPTHQVFTSGSGTYVTPTSPAPAYIKVRMAGGGGGGAGSGTASYGAGGNGNNSTFGSVLTAGGGSGSTNWVGGAGGTATINAPATGLGVQGGGGPGGAYGLANGLGGSGGANPMGGAGWASAGANGIGGSTNTGAGGGGGSCGGSGGQAGAGGAAGGYIEAVIPSPAASYSYTVGTGGGGGSAGTNGFAGGPGAAGIIEVWEFYQ